MSDSPYDPEFVAAQRERLLEERAQVLAEIDADAADILAWSDSEAVEMDQHPGDAATALTEQELDLSLIENSRHILREIDDALARIADGTYGWDEEAEVWIREERLEALPWARLEIEGQRRLEGRQRHERDQYSHDTDLTSL
jgi:DnaK suppressor protein